MKLKTAILALSFLVFSANAADIFSEGGHTFSGMRFQGTDFFAWYDDVNNGYWIAENTPAGIISTGKSGNIGYVKLTAHKGRNLLNDDKLKSSLNVYEYNCSNRTLKLTSVHISQKYFPKTDEWELLTETKDNPFKQPEKGGEEALMMVVCDMK